MEKQKTFQENQTSKLYIIGTPIGNLQDISLRALEALKTVDSIACEDTRNSLKLLSHFQIQKPLIAYHEHNEKETGPKIIQEIQSGRNVAYISDAGNPLISDPGSILIQLAHASAIDVVTILGPSAFLHALINSGFETSAFVFLGFLKRQNKERLAQLRDYLQRPETLIIYEAPHRLKETMLDLQKVFPTRDFCLARELTKLHEEFIYGNFQELDAVPFAALRGEFVIVIRGDSANNPGNSPVNDQEIIEMYHQLSQNNITKKEAISAIVICTKARRNHVYDLLKDL